MNGEKRIILDELGHVQRRFGAAVFWDHGDQVHRCGGVMVHPGVFLLWPICGEGDVPTGDGFKSARDQTTCPQCLSTINAAIAAQLDAPASAEVEGMPALAVPEDVEALAARLENSVTATGGIDLRDPELLRQAATALRASHTPRVEAERDAAAYAEAAKSQREWKEEAERFLRLRDRQIETTRKAWVRAAEAALADIPSASNNTHPAHDLWLRVELAKMGPVEIVQSTVEDAQSAASKAAERIRELGAERDALGQSLKFEVTDRLDAERALADLKAKMAYVIKDAYLEGYQDGHQEALNNWAPQKHESQKPDPTERESRWEESDARAFLAKYEVER